MTILINAIFKIIEKRKKDIEMEQFNRTGGLSKSSSSYK